MVRAAAIKKLVIFGNAPKSWTKSKTLLIPNLETPGNAPISSIASFFGLHEVRITNGLLNVLTLSPDCERQIYSWSPDLDPNLLQIRVAWDLMDWSLNYRGHIRSFHEVKRSCEQFNSNLLRGLRVDFTKNFMSKWRMNYSWWIGSITGHYRSFSSFMIASKRIQNQVFLKSDPQFLNFRFLNPWLRPAYRNILFR